MTPDEFTEAVRRQLDALEVSSSVLIRPGKERTLEISDKKVIGFELFLFGLNEEESIRVQESGIGGRRRMGCGLFLPTQKVPDLPSERKGD
jgi:CRISPR-associated protein Cas6